MVSIATGRGGRAHGTRFALVTSFLMAVGLLTSCSVSGTPMASEIDVRGLDVGDSPADQHHYGASPAQAMSTLTLDPEDVLARVVTDERDDRAADPDRFAVYGTNQLVHLADDEAAYLDAVAKADTVAFLEGSYVTRARDAAAARQFMTELIEIDNNGHYDKDDTHAPRGVPDASCQRLNSSGDARQAYRFRCYVAYKRYVGVVNTDQESDIAPKTAAQYALLANSI